MESGGPLWPELLVLILLVLANGFCSLAEIAIVGARKTKLAELAKDGNKNARAALEVSHHTEELFSTIQVGITTISILTGMFSGASLSGPVAGFLEQFPAVRPYASGLALFIVMALVTYFSLIIGELAPKWIAIAIPEKAACVVAHPMIWISTAFKPIVSFCSWSTKVVVSALGIHMSGEKPVSEDEIMVLLHQGARMGTFDKEEPEIIDRVFQMNDLTSEDCMTPRSKLKWLDLEDSDEKLWTELEENEHYRLLVGEGSLDKFCGLVTTTDILLDQHQSQGRWPLKESIKKCLYEPVLIPETLTLDKVLGTFKKQGTHEAMVIDEYGILTGMVTLHDVLEQILGDVPGDQEDVEEEKNKILQRDEHSWLVEGLCTIDDFRNYFHIEDELPGEAEDYYKTLGGFLTYRFGYIPKEAEKITYGPYTFEIVDCDNRRIDKVLVTVQPKPETKQEDQEKE